MAKQVLPKRRLENVGLGLTGACVALVALIVVTLIFRVAGQGLSAFFVDGIDFGAFITGTSWVPSDGKYGALSLIVTSFGVMVLSTLFTLPVALGSAIFVVEVRPAFGRKVFQPLVELLVGIPSVVYGLVGMLFFCQFLNMKTSLLAGALTLVIMNLPTIMRTTQESLKTVPQSYREGAFGLGAGKWRVIRTVVLPGCVDGVITGCILSVGRILGESAALLFTAGFAHALNGFFDGLSSAGATLTVALYVYAKEQGQFDVAFAIAAILMLLTLLINGAAMLVERYFRRKRSL